ncbi:elongation factor Ts [Clostridium collagenovorans DSM 3089]|uniref:Elongation factor Ts n=1 Tax=Clostridium collagenovorans DSM 3089 TaxID=1121306 RepID=A0A1M5SV83_9CLOT|nr:translation elongation factor Ts [Clostridium collagenovorans]SHH42399.1 elongation factor Ts [Clostridium collagenovorans DSM 3089]
MISAKMVKELREITGAGMMECKKALTETNGNMEEAVEYLRKKGLAAAAKKAGRVAAEGLVKTFVTEDGKVASVVEVNCETDFVAANEEFIAFVDRIAELAATTNVSNVEELLAAKFNENMTVEEARTALIAKLGENMSVRRFERFTVENGVINGYVHGGGRIGVLVELESDKSEASLIEAAKDVAMHVAAVNPLFLNKDAVDHESLEKEKEIFRVQAINEGKPENIVEKMVVGRINKYYKENCLVDQQWVKNPDLTITQFLNEEAKKIGAAKVTVAKFVRFERGEGIEKKEENFAEEVAKQMNSK